jgi:hypothetical protein
MGVPSQKTDEANVLEKVARLAMKQSGKTFQKLLREELSSPLPVAEPSPGCLNAVETLNFCEDKHLPVNRLAHVEHCMWCQTMLAEVIHTGDGFWQELRRRQAEAAQEEQFTTPRASGERE